MTEQQRVLKEYEKWIESNENVFIPTNVKSKDLKLYGEDKGLGCPVCGIGANGETLGYVCASPDCPIMPKVTC